ncbi:NRDE family protein [Elioraea sp.]|uniref:NRDE family protein n=1 Tax=Elioraea sp. TaxID=2185103 RepID=UPI003F6FADF1
MCTVVMLLRPGHDWPLMLAAIRDEMIARPWDPPAANWPDRPGVVGGRDRLAGGTWMASDGARVACVLNRPGTLGSQPGKRSRGVLPLAALAGEPIDATAFAAFNLVCAGPDGGSVLECEDGRAVRRPVPEGVSMLTAHGLDSGESPRARLHLPRFRAAAAPDPASGDWTSWLALLASTDAEPGAGPRGGMTITPDDRYGTVSASLFALSAVGAPVWLFAAGPPGVAPFRPVALAPAARTWPNSAP